MKPILLALFTLFSLPTFADEAPYEMDQEAVSILNDITGAIRATDAAKIFVKNVTFDKVTATFSADHQTSIINAEGMLIFGGDIACGNLKLEIKATHVRDPMGMGNRVDYTATLDKSDVNPQRHCKVYE